MIYSYGKQIIDSIMTGTKVQFPETPYLGLLHSMPNGTGANGVEIKYPEYARIKLNAKSPVKDLPYMTDAAYEAGDETNTWYYSYTWNRDILYFAENETGVIVEDAEGNRTYEDGSPCTVCGWGLWATPTGGTPYLWGKLTLEKDEDGNEIPMEVAASSVPLFRVHDFKITMK